MYTHTHLHTHLQAQAFGPEAALQLAVVRTAHVQRPLHRVQLLCTAAAAPSQCQRYAYVACAGALAPRTSQNSAHEPRTSLTQCGQKHARTQ